MLWYTDAHGGVPNHSVVKLRDKRNNKEVSVEKTLRSIKKIQRGKKVLLWVYGAPCNVRLDTTQGNKMIKEKELV